MSENSPIRIVSKEVFHTETIDELNNVLTENSAEAIFGTLKKEYEGLIVRSDGTISIPNTEFRHELYLGLWVLAHTTPKLKNLCLKKYKLQRLPPNFSNFVQLESLDLSLNRFSCIPEKVRMIPSLKSLSLQGNPLVVDSSPFLSKITLDIRDVHVEQIPDLVESINIYGYQLETLLPLLQHSSVNKIVIEDFEEIPNYNEELPNITTITVNSALIKSLPSFLMQCPNLTSLTWAHGQILHWPDNLFLPKLTHLSLKYNRIAWLSGNIKRHTQLKTLDLSNNSLRMIPQSVRSCTQLTTLNIANCQIQKVDDALKNMSLLQHLDLSGNPLRSLSPSLATQNLRTINICDTKIEDPHQLNDFVDGIDFSNKENRLISPLVINSPELLCSLRLCNLIRFLPPQTIVEELDLSMQSFSSTEELVELLNKAQPQKIRFWKSNVPTPIPDDCPRPNVVYAEVSLFSKFPDSWHDILVPPQLFSVHIESRFSRSTFRSLLVQIHPDIFDNGYEIPKVISLPHGKEQEYLDLFSKKEILLSPVPKL